MAIDPDRQVVATEYISDDGNTYTLGMRRNHATAAGATIGATNPGYPRGWEPRHIGLVGADGQKASLVIPDPTDALWTANAGSVTIPDLGDFTKTGSSGELRPHKYMTV